MADRGKGRGSIIRLLLESSENESSVFPGSKTSVSGSDELPKICHDSGIETGQSNSSTYITSSSEQRTIRACGRGKLIKSLLEEKKSVSSISGTSSTGKGRGFILEKILQESEDDDASVSLEKLSIKSNEPEPEKNTSIVKEAVIKMGKYGEKKYVTTNYIRLKTDPNKQIFEYEVHFSPEVDSKAQRYQYLNEHRSVTGETKAFDGVHLYLPFKLNDKTLLESVNPNNKEKIKIEIIFKRIKPFNERLHFYNILFCRIMKILNYVKSNRSFYDPTKPKIIPHYKLEVWPGYVTAVDEYEGGIMLYCDVSHRILCQMTVLEKLKEIYKINPENFVNNLKQTLLGSVVITRYNNKSYRIDEIDFKLNPKSTFKLSNGKDISYIEYYKEQYNIDIIDHNQPLLISFKQRRMANKIELDELIFCLVPEICHLTGLHSEIRSNRKVMKDLATYTKITPNQRVSAIRKFYDNINDCKEASDVLSNWGLHLDSKAERLVGRQYPTETIYFGKNKLTLNKKAEFSSNILNYEMIEIENINSWLFIYPKDCLKQAKIFLDNVFRIVGPMGIKINQPEVKILNNDRTETYTKTLRAYLKSNIQIVVLICSTARNDLYSAIKKICCTEIPTPSQVINSKTLRNDIKVRSIVQKIILQMNCKLGGTLWSIKIPLKNIMICGIDTYHDSENHSNSVSAFVASYNDTFTKYYSRTNFQAKKEEIVNGLSISLQCALKEYEQKNCCLPDKIIIFRDGVGDGQLKLCSEFEVPQLKAACNLYKENYNPTLTFIVVQKRINTKIFAEIGKNNYENPNPGFIVDHTITRKYFYDFFLVSQSVREGTVSPTHYIVVSDNSGYEPDIIQRITYKLCFLYYNFPGTIRVPACCQYAHKLAYLVGQNIKRPTSEILANKLFYL